MESARLSLWQLAGIERWLDYADSMGVLVGTLGLVAVASCHISVGTGHCSWYCFIHRKYVAEALGLSADKASLLPDSLCSRLHDSMKVLERAMDEYG